MRNLEVVTDRSGQWSPPLERRVLFASLIGTTIEYFDFFVYATAAVLIFPKLFFPSGDATAATLHSLETFALAFFARPLGSALFGHFGDRVGRKVTLVATLLTMGLSTLLIGLLPTYASFGALSAGLLAACRIGQGLGLGGEWGGALLLATEHAPQGRRAWYGMFPQFGAPVGFFCATAVLLLLGHELTEAQLFEWGWRIPFLASAILVILGLYVRVQLPETVEFRRMLAEKERVRVPVLSLLTRHLGAVVLGALGASTLFVSFYLMTVFTLGWGTAHLGYTRQQLLGVEMVGMLAGTGMIIPAAVAAGRWGARRVMLGATLGAPAFGFLLAPLFNSRGLPGVLLFSIVGSALTCLQFGPLGTALAELFPTAVRYTGVSLTFNVAGILGASLTPYIATWLASTHGLAWVGYYLSAAALISAIALALSRTQRPTQERSCLQNTRL